MHTIGKRIILEFVKHCACLLALQFSVVCMHAQLISGNAFLKGNYVELGIAPYGCWGTTVDAPAGYHPRSNMIGDGPRYNKLGFVADPEKDGWTTGTIQNYFGDYFLAANPFTGWGISIGMVHYYAERSNAGAPPAGLGFINPGSIMSVTTQPTYMQAIWATTVNNIRVRKIITVPLNSGYFVVRTVLTNTGGATASGVYYSEYVNPDNDGGFQDQRLDATEYSTANAVVYQNPGDGRALVKAEGERTRAYMGLGSKDCRAHVFRGVAASPFVQQPVHSVMMYNGTFGIRLSGADATAVNDYIGISFNIGNIAPGDSTAVTFAYVLAEPDLDVALDETDPVFDYAGALYKSGDSIKICPGSIIPVTLSNVENLAWTWSPTTGVVGANSGVHVQLQAGAVPRTYTVSAATLCGAKSATITVSPDLPDPPVVADVNYCQNAAAQPLTATGANLLWYTAPTGGVGDATAPLPSTATPGATTWYVTQGPDAFCPSNRVPLTVHVRPLVNTIDDRSICTSQLPYTWNGINVPVAGIGVATYTAMNQYGCDSIVTLNLQTTSTLTPSISITPTDTTVCSGKAVTFTATSVNGGATPQYQWMKNGVNVGSNTSTYSDPSLRNNDRISCTLTSSEGCVIAPAVTSTVATVMVEPSLTISVTKSNDIDCSIGQTTLTATGGDNYSWTPVAGLANPNLPQTIARPLATTTYQVAVSSAGGCTDTAQITINVDGVKNSVSIPNAFSPNGDGKNDCFGLPARSGMQNAELAIYNRWGERVFFTRDLTQCWNGVYKGGAAPGGVYLYYIKGKGECGEVKLKGSVVLLR